MLSMAVTTIIIVATIVSVIMIVIPRVLAITVSVGSVLFGGTR